MGFRRERPVRRRARRPWVAPVEATDENFVKADEVAKPRAPHHTTNLYNLFQNGRHYSVLLFSLKHPLLSRS